jgi:hypothetical protein
MIHEKLYIYSFKDKIYYNIEDFFSLFKDVICKKINKNLFMIEIKNKKNILKLNEFFIYNQDLYCIVNKSFSLFVFIVGNFTDYFFILKDIEGIKKVFFNLIFLRFIFHILLKIFIKNIIIIKYTIVFLFLISSFFTKNVVKENIDLIKNMNLIQKKIYIGYKKIIQNAKEEKLSDKNEIIIKSDIKINYNINLNKKNKFTEKLDKDTRYFLNIKKGHKKNEIK